MAVKSGRRKPKADLPPESGSIQAGGDVVGRDRIEAGRDVAGRDHLEAGGHIIHAESGATVIVGAQPAAPATDEAPAPGEPPFKGLQYFDERDADLFFGREALTAKLAGQLREHRFLAIVGASGSGKSSLVRAGLVPALKRGETILGSDRWPIHIITPTAHPLKELAASLTR